MVNMLQRFGAGAAAAAVAAAVAASPGAVLAGDCKQASPPPSSRACITDLSQPVVVSQAELGKHDARQIAELEMQKLKAIEQFGQGLKGHNQSQDAKLREILNGTKN